MEMDSRSVGPGKGTLEEVMRERTRAMIEAIVDEELEAALGAARSQRVGAVRAGYRCTNHKLWNLLAKAPAHLREELAEDYRRMIYAPSREAVEQARVGFLRKWKLRCKAVSASFEEAGDELFTFTSFPSSQWKALRTTNALERINEEFRRRTKTQASLPNEEAVLFLLFGLLRSGQITPRRLIGWQDLTNPQMEAA
jgi:putative transposase